MRIAFETNMFLYIFFAHMLSTNPYVYRDLFFKKWGKIRKIRGESKTSVKAHVYTDLFRFFHRGSALIQAIFFVFSIAIFCDKTPRGSAAKTQPSRVVFFSISSGLAGEHMCRPSLPGYLDFKLATELAGTYVHPSPSRGNLWRIHFWIIDDICVDFQFLQNRPSTPGPLLGFFFWCRFFGPNLGLEGRYPHTRPPRGT